MLFFIILLFHDFVSCFLLLSINHKLKQKSTQTAEDVHYLICFLFFFFESFKIHICMVS